ncbi:dienelactone hydrolase family protein [Novosphingobium percolationis]|uniref:dienelactone hydrolase family protein n=1 Tax=Novosphingobium percolationis TaxID=2871811 RepID=UPI001CD2ACF9|nr:dienelactone hydrolase family protein [Novosphingobium percolationis]
MCDELTERDAASFLLDRRRFAALGAGAAVLAVSPGCVGREAPDALPTASRAVTITTPDGKADAFFVYPKAGRHPAVVMWPDIAGLRDAYRTMGTRLAAAGYAVLVVNQYYRSQAAPILQSLSEWRTPAGQETLKPMIAAITPEGTVRDAGAFVAWLDAQAEVDTARKIGSAGYCMGGPFTVRTAVANPARVGAAASFHGANLVADTPDSPHKLLARTQASYLFAIAQNDDERAPGDKDALRAAARAAGRAAEVEVYPAQHGWCTIDAQIYDAVQAEKAWARMLALFKGL